MDLEAIPAQLPQREQSQLDLQQLERQVVVPTSQDAVKKKLREMGEPITCFGEGPYERSARLKKVIAQLVMAGKMAMPKPEDMAPEVYQQTVSGEKKGNDKLFFSLAETEEENQAVLEARQGIAEWSIAAAKIRVEQERKDYGHLRSLTRDARDIEYKRQTATASTYAYMATQIGGARPLSCVRFDPSGEMVATTSWDRELRIWEIPNCRQVRRFTGHTDRVSGLAWFPSSAQEMLDAPEVVCCATASADCTVRLWAMGAEEEGGGAEEKPEEENDMEVDKEEEGTKAKEVFGKELACLRGHDLRCCKVAFHPSGSQLFSTSFDLTWRMWDVENVKQVSEQEGHCREVYALDVHPDGSLLGTSDLSGISRVWDLRTGRSVAVLSGHVAAVKTLAFSPNGYHLATAGDDNTVKLWDLRQTSQTTEQAGRSILSIPAHSNIISSVRWRSDGKILMTGSFDGTIKLWETKKWTSVRTLKEPNNRRVMDCDISPTGDWKHVAGASFNRQLSIYTCSEA